MKYLGIIFLFAFQGQAESNEKMFQQQSMESLEQRARVLSRRDDVKYGIRNLPEKRKATRQEIVDRAYHLLNFRYLVNPENYQPSDIENRCEGRNIWLRPHKIYGESGRMVSSIPYRWGGHFSDVSVFENKLKDGSAAGDVCTCTDRDRDWCIVEDAVGLDCSGFVSHVWQIPYHTTRTMRKVSKKIEWSQLKAGDAINKPGDHMILFLRFSEDGNYFFGIESSPWCGGVCSVVLRVFELKRQGYYPIRLNKVL